MVALAVVLAVAVTQMVPGKALAQTVTSVYTEIEIFEGHDRFDVVLPEDLDGRSDWALLLRRTGDLFGESRVRLVVHPGSATEGADYLVLEGGHTALFRSGEETARPLIPLTIHDGLVEDPEDFWVELVVEEGGIRGEPYLTRIVILDNPKLELSIESEPQSWSDAGTLGLWVEVRNLGNHDIEEAMLRLTIPTALDLNDGACGDDNAGWSVTTPEGFESLVLSRTFPLSAHATAGFRACGGLDPASMPPRSLFLTMHLDHPAPRRSASLEVPPFPTPPCEWLGLEWEGCCAFAAVACVLQPFKYCPGTVSGSTSWTRSHRSSDRLSIGDLAAGHLVGLASRGLRRAAALLPRFFQLDGDLNLLYRVRHELEKSTEGRRLVELYYEHGQALKEAILGELDLLFETSALLDAWRRPLQSLADEDAARERITQTQIDRLVAYLDALEAAAGPALRQVIAREREAHDLEAFVGQTVAEAVARVTTPPPAPCVPSSEVACLLGGRFEVRVDWETAEATGTGRVMAFGGQRAENDESVFMWFFNPENFEMGIKMVDACVPPFDKFWAFQSGLTNQGYTVHIRDTVTDAVKTYSNTRGTLPTTSADTAAFDCP